MKTVQKFFVFGLFMTAGLIFAGCGDTAATGDGGGDSTPAATEGSGDKAEATEGSGDKAENASTTPAGDGEFQLVSLKVPHMT